MQKFMSTHSWAFYSLWFSRQKPLYLGTFSTKITLEANLLWINFTHHKTILWRNTEPYTIPTTNHEENTTIWNALNVLLALSGRRRTRTTWSLTTRTKEYVSFQWLGAAMSKKNEIKPFCNANTNYWIKKLEAFTSPSLCWTVGS